MEKLKKTLKQERFADTVALLTMENSSGEISFHVASNIKKVKDPTLKSILKENNLEFGIRQEHRHIIVDTIQKVRKIALGYFLNFCNIFLTANASRVFKTLTILRQIHSYPICTKYAIISS